MWQVTVVQSSLCSSTALTTRWRLGAIQVPVRLFRSPRSGAMNSGSFRSRSALVALALSHASSTAITAAWFSPSVAMRGLVKHVGSGLFMVRINEDGHTYRPTEACESGR